MKANSGEDVEWVHPRRWNETNISRHEINCHTSFVIRTLVLVDSRHRRELCCRLGWMVLFTKVKTLHWEVIALHSRRGIYMKGCVRTCCIHALRCIMSTPFTEWSRGGGGSIPISLHCSRILVAEINAGSSCGIVIFYIFFLILAPWNWFPSIF